MITVSELEACLTRRVVLTCDNNVSYAGVVRQSLSLEGKEGALLTLDQRSGFSIWCPLAFVKTLLVVPFSEQAPKTISATCDSSSGKAYVRQ